MLPVTNHVFLTNATVIKSDPFNCAIKNCAEQNRMFCKVYYLTRHCYTKQKIGIQKPCHRPAFFHFASLILTPGNFSSICHPKPKEPWLICDNIFHVKNFYFYTMNSLILLLLCTSWKKNILSAFNCFDKEAFQLFKS